MFIYLLLANYHHVRLFGTLCIGTQLLRGNCSIVRRKKTHINDDSMVAESPKRASLVMKIFGRSQDPIFISAKTWSIIYWNSSDVKWIRSRFPDRYCKLETWLRSFRITSKTKRVPIWTGIKKVLILCSILISQ